jgi:DNA repair exonuclease SbcCD ATPase subunit
MFLQESRRFYADMVTALSQVGVSQEQSSAFEVRFTGDVNAILEKRTTEVQKRIEVLEGTEQTPLPGTARRLAIELAMLEALITQDQAKKERIDAIQRRLASIATELGRIEQEITNIEGIEKVRWEQVRAERLRSYLSYFDTLKEEQSILEALYKPVKERLNVAGAEEQSLEFNIRWDVDLESWLERGMDLFDHRKLQPFGGINGIRSMITSSQLLMGWRSGNHEKIKAGIDELLQKLRDSKAHLSLKSSATVSHLLEWAFYVEHIKLSYGLRYNATELEKLSPGTKGIVLLILYLGMDIEDSRPLLIDQPEENLDSESIYKLLSRYFREAKNRRQVILITHNPNLVVNTDSDQIIIAKADRQENGLPAITYVSGAMENSDPVTPGIRQNVCRILEGGEQAFFQRERRYGIERQI